MNLDGKVCIVTGSARGIGQTIARRYIADGAKVAIADRLAYDTVESVHGLHVWTITSGLDAMNCHLTVADDATPRETLQSAHDMMRDEFGIEKTTIQIEHEGLHKVVDDDHAGNSDDTA